MLELAMSGNAGEETLDDLNVTDVFERCLEAHNVSAERRPDLLSAYKEIIVSLNEQDLRAE
jgi:exonuclease SbcD